MRRVTRGITILSAVLATLAVALPASAAEGRSVKGVLVSVSASGVTFKDAKSVVTTCSRAAKSPSLDGFSAGDRVLAACVRVRGHLVLAKIRHMPAANGSASNNAEPVKFGGAVTALTDAAIALRDGDRAFTCSLGTDSPSTANVKIGQHVKVLCANGKLLAIQPVASADPSHGETPNGQSGAGTISALSASSVTFHNDEHGDATCSVGASSPALTGYSVGDRVKFGCLSGALVAIAKDGSGTVEGPHKSLGAAGAVSAVSPTSLTVHTDGGEVTCSIGDGSPSVSGLHTGDTVKVGCLDGVLKVIMTAPAPAPPTGDHHDVKTVAGTLSMLSDTSVTVHSPEKGDVSCTVGASSPRLGDFHPGDRVGLLCTDGVVAKLVKLP
jgi:hypothetical protein